jgi:PPR repeat
MLLCYWSDYYCAANSHAHTDTTVHCAGTMLTDTTVHKQTNRVQDVLDHMRAVNLEPHDWHQAQLLLAHGRAGNWEIAVNLLQKMREPGISSYNAAIGACVRCGAWQRAQELFQEAKQSGLELVALTYRAVIEGAEDAGVRDVIHMTIVLLKSCFLITSFKSTSRCVDTVVFLIRTQRHDTASVSVDTMISMCVIVRAA